MSPTTETSRPLELVNDKLYRLGGVVEVDGRVSWVPADATGFEPINCYLLHAGDGALLVDTGVACHRRQVIEQIKDILGDRTSLSVFLTRFEPDCLTNLTALTSEFEIEQVYGGGVSNPFDFFDDLSAEEQLRHDYRVELVRKMPGDVVPISPGRDLTLVVTTIRLLTTFWAYDSETRTLFTSDAFGHMRPADADTAPTVDEKNDTATIETVRKHLLTKFDWLRGAETGPLQDDLKSTFDNYPVEIVAPTHGSVLRGASTVERHLDLTQQVLGEIVNS